MGFLMKTSCNSQGYYKEEGENWVLIKILLKYLEIQQVLENSQWIETNFLNSQGVFCKIGMTKLWLFNNWAQI